MIPLLFSATIVSLTLIVYYYRGSVGTLTHWLVPVMVVISFGFVYQPTNSLPAFTAFSLICLILLATGLYVERPKIQWQITDALALGYAGVTAVAAWQSLGTSAMNLAMGTMVTSVVVPYFMVRVLVRGPIVHRFLLAFALAIFAVSLFSPFEAVLRLKINAPLQAIWPEWVLPDDFLRGGFNRVALAFIHPIHAGLMLAIGAGLFFVFRRSESAFSRGFGVFALLWLILAVYLTGSRSGLIFCAVLFPLLNFHFVRAKWAYATVFLLALVLVLAVAMPAFDAYAGAKYDGSLDETQTSAMYRKTMLENYAFVIGANPLWGYGVEFPVINGQRSIDNAYYYMSLVSGVPATVVFWLASLVSALTGLGAYFFRPINTRDKTMIWTVFSFQVFLALGATIVWFTGQVSATVVILWALMANLSERREKSEPLMAKVRWL